MLRAVTIQDLAIIRHLDLEFKTGLTVITGETGAGKSIVIDALGLVLGDRADSGLVRIGAERANIGATFVTSALPALREYLTAHELAAGDECLLRRVVSADGRSRAFCNETPVTLTTLKEIGSLLLDIHGQHEHHSLLQRPTQRALLDDFGRLHGLVQICRDAYVLWHQATAALQALHGDGTDVVSRCEFLRFQIQELADAKLDASNLAQLEGEHRRLSHVQRLREVSAQIAQRTFEGERSALRQLTQAQHQLSELRALDPALQSVVDLFEQATIVLSEAEREMVSYGRAVADEDPEKLAQIERHFEKLHDLARKFRCEPATLPALLGKFSSELALLESREQRVDELTRVVEQQRNAYDIAAQALSKARHAQAVALARATTKILRDLGMPHASFAVELADTAQPSPLGTDDVEFMLTTNADQPRRALRKIASGGELSRSSLAIQVATAGIARMPTLIYDEIDTGIGGRVASVVASHLRALARDRQILCITHLPQVASAGSHHLLITKTVDRGTTVTRAEYLAADARIDEIAKMLGGAEPTAKSRAHARELLAD